MRETELSYLAGLTDGDGSFLTPRIHHKKNYIDFEFAIGSTEKELVTWIPTSLGIGHLGKQVIYRKRGEKRAKPMEFYRIYDREEILTFCNMIQPYLKSSRKKRICQLFIELIEYRFSHLDETKEVLQKEIEIVNEIRRLNRKGGRSTSRKRVKTLRKRLRRG